MYEWNTDILLVCLEEYRAHDFFMIKVVMTQIGMFIFIGVVDDKEYHTF